MTANYSHRIYFYQFKYKYVKKQKSFAAFFAFLESTLNLQYFETKDKPHRSSISEVKYSEICTYPNAYQRLFLKTLLAVNVLTIPKNRWNLEKHTFILVFHHCEPSYVRKKFFLSDMKFYDCLLTRWLPTTSILVVIERIYCYKIKYNYLNNQKLFLFFFFFSCCYCIFGIYVKLHCFEKKWAS